MKDDELKIIGLTVKQAVAILGIHDRTIMRMLEDGRLSGIIINSSHGKKILINPKDIAALLTSKSESKKKRYPRAKKGGDE